MQQDDVRFWKCKLDVSSFCVDGVRSESVTDAIEEGSRVFFSVRNESREMTQSTKKLSQLFYVIVRQYFLWQFQSQVHLSCCIRLVYL